MVEHGLGDNSEAVRERTEYVREVKGRIMKEKKLKFIAKKDFERAYSHWISVVKTRNHALSAR